MRLEYENNYAVWVPESESEKRDVNKLKCGAVPLDWYNWEEVGYKTTIDVTHQEFFDNYVNSPRWRGHFKFLRSDPERDWYWGDIYLTERNFEYISDELKKDIISVEEYKFLKDFGLRFKRNSTQGKFEYYLEKLDPLTKLGT